jgi:hypothetical protein
VKGLVGGQLMSIFTIDYRAAKASLHEALNEAERGVAAGDRPGEAMAKLESELDLFVDVVRDLDGRAYKGQVLKLFRASNFRAARLHKMVDVISDWGLRLWVRIVLFPVVFVVRGVAGIVKFGMGR